MHLEAFHQAEVFCLDDRAALDARQMTGRVIESAETLLPGRAQLDVEDDGRWFEVMAWRRLTAVSPAAR